MDRSDAECRSQTGSISPLVEPFGRVFNTERAGSSVAFRVELEDEADEFGLNRINLQLLFNFGSATLCLPAGMERLAE